MVSIDDSSVGAYHAAVCSPHGSRQVSRLTEWHGPIRLCYLANASEVAIDGFILFWLLLFLDHADQWVSHLALSYAGVMCLSVCYKSVLY